MLMRLYLVPYEVQSKMELHLRRGWGVVVVHIVAPIVVVVVVVVVVDKVDCVD